jgi:O-antigen ligase
MKWISKLLDWIPSLWFRWAYLAFSLLLVVGIYFSHAMVSIAVIAFASLFILERNYAEKWERIKTNKTAIAFISLFALHLIGLIYTSNFDYAFNDLRIKLPLLAFPIAFGSLQPFEKIHFKIVLYGFIISSLLAVTYSSYIYFYESPLDTRQISPIISHIRLSLLIALAIFVSIYLFVNSKSKFRFMWFAPAIMFLSFLFILMSLTGIVAFFVAAISYIFFIQWNSKLYRFKTALLLLGFILFGVFANISYQAANNAFANHEAHLNTNNIAQFTSRGNPYKHHWDVPIRENGYHVKYFLCEKELEEAWAERSNLNYFEKDQDGWFAGEILQRYLSSKGLRKDYEGVMALSKEDIQAIEEGVANADFVNSSKLYVRAYQTFWELDVFLLGITGQSSSLVQRIVYWNAAWSILKENMLLGVGTGDVQEAFNTYYKKQNTNLGEHYWLRSHNQFLSFGVSFGFIGILTFIFCFAAPFLEKKHKNNLLFLVFWIMAATSMFFEDTLETQIGVTYFCFFFWFFLLKPQNEEQPSSKN